MRGRLSAVGHCCRCAESLSTVDAARAADGCLDFALTADLLDPGRIIVCERWASDEQLLAFRDCGPGDEQTVAIRDASVHKYRISAVEAP
ncbi:putative quinol monooxygenase [Micromonospora inyonensis]|uniref:Antibiotic biosynthesis monooxygenase n=1 Tax=Micromonospora inyonensis TaxID=47866 RepID=A0A1C6RR35_9ACTN|nr:antibiotic biosynthesis monooxygenase family protein [Micromonospora inyonensis]SCL19489.1 Antibiotic biosynthesis monooxygenase [Micromonospora inyonensis]